MYLADGVGVGVGEGGDSEMVAEPEGERYPIFLPTGAQRPVEQVVSVLRPERVNAVEG